MSTSIIDYQESLNEQQRDAVTSTQGPHLVIAGAGSGKTRVLVYRTAYLVDQGVYPYQILLLTFTRRAANEMLERASVILDDRCRRVSGGTFHSFANMILRQYADRIDLSRNFTILDEADASAIVQRIREEKGLNKLDKRFPRKDTIFSIICKSVNKCTDVENVLYEEYPQFLQWTDQIGHIKQDYAIYKREMGVLDFDDLLIALRNLLQTKEDVRQQLSRRYEYIMVDEYQDTNKVQSEIVRLLASEHDNVMVVGDDSQSIYSFRGAHFKNIIDFPRHFPGATVIKLEENYRSSQPILDLTNEVILSAREKFEKTLFTRKEGDQRPVYRDTLNENAQSKYIVNQIQTLREQGLALGDIAVLFRSGWHSNDLEIELSSCGIPFMKYGGHKFLESAHVKDAMSYLRLLYNPSDQVSWVRALTLMRGVGPKTAVRIAQDVAAKGVSPVDRKIFKGNVGIQRLFEFIEAVDLETQSPTEILDLALQFYYPFLMDRYDDYDKRANDLESLQQIVERYTSLEQFLADLTLDPPEKSVIDARRYRRQDKDALVLSTIHSAKGLEWDTVFVLHLCEGFLPSYRSFDNQEAMEEERRLFYVATTRAKNRLYLLRPQMVYSRFAGGTNSSPYTRVSRFLGEGRILDLLVEIEHRQSHSHRTQRQYGNRDGINQAIMADYFDRTESSWDNW